MKSITAKRAPARGSGPGAGSESGPGLARAGGRAGGSCLGRWVTDRTWCAAPRKPLFLRRRTPRLPDQRRRRRAGRGAPLPAKPCSFVVEHHVFRVKGAGGGPDVVRRSPQNLFPSSPSTTSSGAKAPATGRTWCAAPHKPLFLRRRAPRLPGPRRRRRAGRGAPLPAKPFSFVAEHHVFRVKGAGGGPDVVRRSSSILFFSKMAKIDAQRPVRAFRASIFNSCQTGITYSNSKAPVYSW